MAERNLPHIVLEGFSKSEPYSGRQGRGGGKPSDVADARRHAERILAELRQIQSPEQSLGTYLDVIGREGEGFAAEKFNVSGLSLLRIDEGNPETGEPARATVLALKAKRGIDQLERKITAFAEPPGLKEDGSPKQPRNADLAQSIGSIVDLEISRLWRHPSKPFPASHDVIDWELWIDPNHLTEFLNRAHGYGVQVYGDRLRFPEDVVVIASANRDQLSRAIKEIGVVRGIAAPAAPMDFTDNMEAEEQAEWLAQLQERTAFAQPSSRATSYATLLDTGVTLAHPLIQPALDANDRHAAVRGWDVRDVNGHGSVMAGLTLYGDLRPVLDGASPVVIRHRLESSKVIPDVGQNPHHLLGTVSANAINMVEAEHDRLRTFIAANSTYDDSPHSGAPTSWSTELDQLASGVSGTRRKQRLIVSSVGNIDQQTDGVDDYLALCDHPDSEVLSPSQAWNVISVGSMTEMNGHGGFTEGKTLAPVADLSPVSRTASWPSVWPIKPDIVMEGGNWYVDAATGYPSSHPDLMLVSTSHNYPQRSFVNAADTSASAALAGREMAILRDTYPDLWPETIRALYVGSARWTDQMWSNIPKDERNKKGALEVLFRRYGYGQPDLERALASASNAVAMIVQDQIRPYENKGSSRKLHEMRLIALPWPVEVLRAIGDDEVTLRIALSYFIEPNPSETARGRRDRYASHRLRFELKGPDESVEEFKIRLSNETINDDVEDEDEMVAPEGNKPSSSEWTFGKNRRNVGSLHIDTMKVKASDLAHRGCIAVHPLGGWWKDNRIADPARSVGRFSLVVEIDSTEIEAEIYAEVTHAIEIANLV